MDTLYQVTAHPIGRTGWHINERESTYHQNGAVTGVIWRRTRAWTRLRLSQSFPQPDGQRSPP